MAWFVELNAIRNERVVLPEFDTVSLGVEAPAVDDLELPVAAPPAPTPVYQHETFPLTVNVATVREFYPRKDNQPGTRIVFQNGSAWPVIEDYAAVKALFMGGAVRD